MTWSSEDTAAAAAAATAAGPAAWESFYLTHSVNRRDGAKGHRVQAFKDRHYLRREFVELMPPAVRDDPKAWSPPLDPAALPPPDLTSPDAKVVLELGCGVGNSAFPLMRANLDMFVYACDCSPTAITALVSNPEYDLRRCCAFVADLAGDHPLRQRIADDSVDAVTGVFFFSALDDAAFARVARECVRVLRPGGVVLFRDYAADDVKNKTGGGGGGSGVVVGGESESHLSLDARGGIGISLDRCGPLGTPQPMSGAGAGEVGATSANVVATTAEPGAGDRDDEFGRSGQWEGAKEVEEAKERESERDGGSERGTARGEVEGHREEGGEEVDRVRVYDGKTVSSAAAKETTTATSTSFAPGAQVGRDTSLSPKP